MRCVFAAMVLASLTALLLTGCGERTARVSEIRSAHIVTDPAPVYEANVDLRFSRAMLQALDRGIPLKLVVHIAGHDERIMLSETHTLQLRYLPLARRYQRRDLESGTERTFERRAQLLASLDRLRIPLARDWSAMSPGLTLSTRVALDKTSLPGPLRLPALFLPEWQVVNAEYTWQARG